MEIMVWLKHTNYSTPKKKLWILIFLLLLSIIRNYRKRHPTPMLTQGPIILGVFISIIASLVYLLSTVFLKWITVILNNKPMKINSINYINFPRLPKSLTDLFVIGRDHTQTDRPLKSWPCLVSTITCNYSITSIEINQWFTFGSHIRSVVWSFCYPP